MAKSLPLSLSLKLSYFWQKANRLFPNTRMASSGELRDPTTHCFMTVASALARDK